jgi:release factor glutamine methyltransferase
MVRLRTRGIPLEHVLGWADFMGLRVAVARGVFVPRRRSALLVREAAARVTRGDVVLDLCCGSGALGLALARMVDVELHAADLSLAAVDCASRNLAAVGGHVYRGDLFGALPDALRGTFRVVVCNAPYVPTGMIGTLPPEARLHEPVGTLDGGTDGLDVVRRVAREAPHWLADGGHLLVESSSAQATTAAGVFEQAGLSATMVLDPELEATAVIGTCERQAG